MPDKLLTTRELVDLLQLDRVTIYKLVKDSELPALRVGGQWRFSASDVDAWLKRQRDGQAAALGEAAKPSFEPHLTDFVPLQTLRMLQDQFADILHVSSFITDLDGQPLAPCHRCSRFCRIVHTHAVGMAACQASWRAIARTEMATGATIHMCHAGIQYASAPVIVNGRRLGMVTAGQFLTTPPEPSAFARAARTTAAALNVDGEALAQAMDSIELVSSERAVQITNLLATIANAISAIGYQSYQARQTLNRIAQLSAAQESELG